jgi:hypothetical protein
MKSLTNRKGTTKFRVRGVLLNYLGRFALKLTFRKKVAVIPL